MGEFSKDLTTVLLSIAAVAAIAVIVSKNSQSPAVIQNLGSAYGNALDVAVSPVTGQATAPNLSYANSGGSASLPDLGSISGGIG
jgi:hypothetical protein